MRIIGIALTTAALATVCQAQGNLLPNPSFEEGAQGPVGWTASSEACAWTDVAHSGARGVAVTGNRDDTCYWSTPDPGLAPGRVYEFSAWMRRAEGSAGGLAITGPNWANRDVSAGEQWSRTSHIFVPPQRDDPGYIRVGHWHAQGTIHFDDVAVAPVIALPMRRGDLVLGEGEAVEGREYSCRAPIGGYGGNYSRALHSHTAHLNTQRWVFFPGAEVIYRHDVGGVAMTAATVTVSIGWYAAGTCHVEASRDGAGWTEIGRMNGLGEMVFEVPEKLLPAEALFVRLRSPGEGEEREDSAPGSFQVYSYVLRAELAQEIEPLHGTTTFLVEEVRSDRLAVEPLTLGALLPGRDNVAEMVLRNPGAAAMDVRPGLEFVSETGEVTRFDVRASVPAGGETAVRVPYAAGSVGHYDAAVRVVGEGGEELYHARFGFDVPELYRADYGYAIGSDEVVDLWWCEGTYKVNRDRPAPTASDPTVRLEAGRGEFEPVQVVVRPKRDLSALTARVSDLSGPGGASIPASAIDILRVGYVYVHTPTDAQGAVGWWPDPLPPLDEPVDVAAGQNQPLWLRVGVPRDAASGEYRGRLTLRANGWQSEVPLSLRVFDFEMPARRGIVATMGFSAGNLRRYHHLQTDEQLAQVFDLYMRSFRAHRIDPYGPWLEGPRTEVVGIHWEGGAVLPADDAPEGRNVMHVVDDSETANPAAATTARMPVDRERAYRLSFAARAALGHEFQTTIGCFDGAGNWMSGRNVDNVHVGTGAWERYEVNLPAGRLAEGCRSVQVTLRPCRWADPGTTTGEAWFDDVFLGEAAEGAENLLADGGFEAGADDVRIAVDFSAWDPWLEQYIDGLGFQSFRLPIGYMPRRGGLGQVGPYQQGSAEYDRIVGEYLRALQEHLREKGWLDEAYAYWVDEPEPRDYENVRYGMRLLDEWAPEIRRMLTEQPEEELVGYVDIWCPVLHNYVEEDCRARQAAGDQIWWYVCTGPKAPYAGLFTDHNAVDLRIWQWMTWKYGVEGCLIWATNYWYSGQRVQETGQYQNPWEDPQSYRSSGGGWWGNGDGRFLYPPNVDPNAEHEPILTGPVDSIRWEMLREGLEDWEYFHALAQRLDERDDAARRLLTIPEAILVSPREFTRDPLPMYAHRRALLEALERLGE
ncbi:MAG: glycoside hydrolase domain-containing protein [Armatimonadota bacterium]